MPHPIELQLQQMSNALGAMGRVVQQLQKDHEGFKATSAQVSVLKDLLHNIKATPLQSVGGGDFKASKAFAKGWGGSAYASLDAIRGRFLPFDQFVEIPIPANTSTSLTGTLKITPDGPFVAAYRYAVFQSRVVYEVAFANGTKARFNGRTHGRFRGIASNTDLMDALRAFEQPGAYQPTYLGAVYDGSDIIPVQNPAGVNQNSVDPTNMIPPFPGTGRPLFVSPMSMSAGRSMQFDGTIAIQPQGAQFNRQNIPVPSSLWSRGLNGPVELPCYDVFEPTEEVLVTVNPTHTNNPSFGNISGLGALNADYTFNNATGVAANNPFPAGSWPFLASQFDGHEGINDETLIGDSEVNVDRVTRVFDGSLYIGYLGFRIIAPPGG